MSIAIITCTDIYDNERVSYQFMFESNAPYEIWGGKACWGMLVKRDNYNINLFNSNGLVVAANAPHLSSIVKEIEKHDSCIFFKREYFDEFITHLSPETEVKIHHFDGALKSS